MLDFLQSHLVLIVILLAAIVAFWLLHGTAKSLWTKEKAQFIAIERRLADDLYRAKLRIETLEHELTAYRFGSAAKLNPAAAPIPGGTPVDPTTVPPAPKA